MTRRDLVPSSKWYFVCENEISFSTRSCLHFNCRISLIRKQCFFKISKTITRSHDLWSCINYMEISRDFSFSERFFFTLLYIPELYTVSTYHNNIRIVKVFDRILFLFWNQIPNHAISKADFLYPTTQNGHIPYLGHTSHPESLSSNFK